MKKLALLLSWAFCLSALAAYDYAPVRDGMTEEQAKSLGMTEVISVKHKKIVQLERALQLDSEAEDALKAKVVIIVNKASDGTHPDAQTAKVYVDGILRHVFTVSTGSEKRVTTRAGKTYVSTTPTGYFRPRRLYRKYYSSLWGGAPMHFSTFYIPGSGIALHSTTPNHYHELGTRASGGCVRFHPDDAEIAQNLILDTTALKDEIQVSGKYSAAGYFYDEPVRASNGRRYIRKRYNERKWAYPILGIYRKTGVIYNETQWNSTDVLIVVKNGDGL